MSEPITLSDQLFVDAQAAAALGERSAAGQIEYWARLGRSVDILLTGCQRPDANSQGRELADCLLSVPTAEGREQLAAYLASRPYPHYEAASDGSGDLIRIEEDGTRTRGQFDGRTFRPSGSSEAP